MSKLEGMPRGGKREGAGRAKKPEEEKAKQRNYRLTDEENEIVKAFIKALKGKSK